MSDWSDIRDSVGLTLRPIDHWPGKRTPRSGPSPFSAKWSDTIRLLKRELGFLSAKKVVLQINVRERDLRLDGLPRADARLEDPAVILSFDCPHGSLMLPCDTFAVWETQRPRHRSPPGEPAARRALRRRAPRGAVPRVGRATRPRGGLTRSRDPRPVRPG